MPSAQRTDRLSALLTEYDVLKANVAELEARYHELLLPQEIAAHQQRLADLQSEIAQAEQKLEVIHQEQKKILELTFTQLQEANQDAMIRQAERMQTLENYRREMDRSLSDQQQQINAQHEQADRRLKECARREQSLDEQQTRFSFVLKEFVEKWQAFKREGDRVFG